ncbi:MAG TPA: dephospho-CoA kinase [Candidatus Limnocylindrales bacterium]
MSEDEAVLPGGTPVRPARGPGRTVRIGLTGPIGCGKTTVAGWLAELGARVVDADALAREVSSPGSPVLAAIVARFGPGILSAGGSLDRAALGRIVFTDPESLRALEAIVHPAVRPLIEATVATAEAEGARAVVIEAIKLVEGGFAAACDEVWLVTCSPAEQRRRLLGRGAPPEDVAHRIAAQGDLVVRVRPAVTRVLSTGGRPSVARARVRRLFARALSGAVKRP